MTYFVPVIPSSCRFQVLNLFHKKLGHQGISRSTNMIKRYFWWKGLRNSVQRHIRTCPTCLQFFPNVTKKRTVHPDIPKIPFSKVAIDLVTLPLTTKGNCYALTCVCLFSGFLSAIPIPNKEGRTLLNTFLQHIVARF